MSTVLSTYHQWITYLIVVKEIKEDQEKVKSCYNTAMKNIKSTSISKKKLSARCKRQKITHQSCNHILTIGLKDYETVHMGARDEGKNSKINSKLSTNDKEDWIEFLKRNVKLFAWKLEEMLGINPNIITYEIKMDYMKKLVQ